MNEEYVWKEATGKLSVLDTKPNHNMTFHNQDGKQIGALDFNGPEMTFTGDADESAKLFFDLIARSFKERLEQERADERNSWPAEMEAMERQVNILTDALAQEREACAKVCDETLAQHYMKQTIPERDEALLLAACADCATAIRARKTS